VLRICIFKQYCEVESPDLTYHNFVSTSDAFSEGSKNSLFNKKFVCYKQFWFYSIFEPLRFTAATKATQRFCCQASKHFWSSVEIYVLKALAFIIWTLHDLL
jgi:hypothetical protein